MPEEKPVEVTPKVEVKAEEPKVETPEKKFVPEEEYKNLQREVSKREARIRELEESHASVKEIKEELAKLREDNASLYDYVAGKLTQDETAEKPNKLDALRAERQTQTVVGQHRAVVDNLLKDSGIDPNDAKLELARAYWKAGDLEKSVSEVRRVTSEAKVSKDTTNIDALVEERVNARVEKALTDAGLKKFPGGQPPGQADNYNDIRDAYIKNSSDPNIAARYHEARRKRGL